MLTRILSIAVLLLLSACVSTRPVSWPWAEPGNAGSGSTICQAAVCTASDARIALSTASKYCTRIIQRHDGSDALFGGSKVAVSTLGALSGSVISQLAEGSAAQAWAGVSGVANGMQTQMDQAFSGALDVRRKQHVATAASEGAEAFYKTAPTGGTDYGPKVEQAIRMALACAVNGAKADGSAMQLLAGGSPADPAPIIGTEPIVTMEDGVITALYAYTNPTQEARAQGDLRARKAAESICGAGAAVLQKAPRFSCVGGSDCEATATFTCAP